MKKEQFIHDITNIICVESAKCTSKRIRKQRYTPNQVLEILLRMDNLVKEYQKSTNEQES